MMVVICIFNLSAKTRLVESPGRTSSADSPDPQLPIEGVKRSSSELSKVQRLKKRLQHSFSKLGLTTLMKITFD
jgi:hypothetical protein